MTPGTPPYDARPAPSCRLPSSTAIVATAITASLTPDRKVAWVVPHGGKRYLEDKGNKRRRPRLIMTVRRHCRHCLGDCDGTCLLPGQDDLCIHHPVRALDHAGARPATGRPPVLAQCFLGRMNTGARKAVIIVASGSRTTPTRSRTLRVALSGDVDYLVTVELRPHLDQLLLPIFRHALVSLPA